MTKCNPDIDTGYTKADLLDKKRGFFCVYFARGCCTEGVNCRFYHRVPQHEDIELHENLRDIFGRSRHANFKEDKSGIGSFSHECTTLQIEDITLPDSSTAIKEVVRQLYEMFSPWGEVKDIHFDSMKCIAWVKYEHRHFAEFAKEAMED